MIDAAIMDRANEGFSASPARRIDRFPSVLKPCGARERQRISSALPEEKRRLHVESDSSESDEFY